MIDYSDLAPGEIAHPAAYKAAIKRNIIRNARKTWRETFGERAERIIAHIEAENLWAVENLGYEDNFSNPKVPQETIDGWKLPHKLAFTLGRYGKLSEGQTNLFITIMDKQAERKAQWAAEREAKNANKTFVGTVGAKKVEMTVTFVHRINFEGGFGGSLEIMEDEAGNTIVYKGNSLPYPCDIVGYTGVAYDRAWIRGDKFSFTCTIKSHDDSKYGKQTRVAMVKNMKIISLADGAKEVEQS